MLTTAIPRPEPQGRPSLAMLAAVTLFVIGVGTAGYLWQGDPEGLHVGPGEGGEPALAAAGAAPHATDAAQIEGMVQRLAERLATQGDDAEGWAMLARSYGVLGRHDAAAAAYARLVELKPTDAQALADYADALATQAQGRLDGEPERLIERALAADPAHVKALALAGTLAFDRQDLPKAIALWERAAAAAGPDGPLAAQLAGALREARARSAPGAAASTPQAASAHSIRGQVRLAPELQRLVSADDTVFVFARSTEGGRPPLAIQRFRASELPVQFSLDEKAAMGSAGGLVAGQLVVVGARISKTGDARPRPGDIQTLSAPVAVGTQGLQLVVDTLVKPQP